MGNCLSGSSELEKATTSTKLQVVALPVQCAVKAPLLNHIRIDDVNTTLTSLPHQVAPNDDDDGRRPCRVAEGHSGQDETQVFAVSSSLPVSGRTATSPLRGMAALHDVSPSNRKKHFDKTKSSVYTSVLELDTPFASKSTELEPPPSLHRPSAIHIEDPFDDSPAPTPRSAHQSQHCETEDSTGYSPLRSESLMLKKDEGSTRRGQRLSDSAESLPLVSNGSFALKVSFREVALRLDDGRESSVHKGMDEVFPSKHDSLRVDVETASQSGDAGVVQDVLSCHTPRRASGQGLDEKEEHTASCEVTPIPLTPGSAKHRHQKAMPKALRMLPPMYLPSAVVVATK